MKNGLLLKIVFALATVASLLNTFISESGGEMLAWGCSSIFALTSFMLLVGGHLLKQKEDEGC